MVLKNFAVTMVLSLCAVPAFAIGPSFCGASALPPGARLVCSSPELSRSDLAYEQVYYVMRQIVGQPGWQNLKVATIDYENDVLRHCGVPISGPLPPNILPMADCVGRAFEAQRWAWLDRLTGAALEEARRPVEQHLALQQRLQATRFLPADSPLDGVYGVGVRVAIYAWQRANSRPETGFISDADAAILNGVMTPLQIDLQASNEAKARAAAEREAATAQRQAAEEKQRAEQARAEADIEAEARRRAEESRLAARRMAEEQAAATRLAEETRTAAQMAAEHSPNNHCKEPKFAGKLIDSFTNLLKTKDSPVQAIDIEHLTTVNFESGDVWSCRGVFVLTNGERSPGIISSRLNVVGQPIVSFRAEV